MSVGDRVCFNSSYGTIRYVGHISGKQGVWIGIEWDELTRGKGDGMVAGTRYFQARSPNGASFLRSNSPSLKYGRTLVEALRDKYIEERADAAVENIVLGSSDGAIEVEAVNMNKVRGKFAQLETLREVGLEGYFVSSAGPPGEISATCPGIRRLELSQNLISDWSVVVEIAQQLPVLESISLYYNSLRELASPLAGSCRSVTELWLGRTGIDWNQSMFVSKAFPHLTLLELGNNGISSLEATSGSPPDLKTLNLDRNTISDWPQLMQSLARFSHLQNLFLSENQIASIRAPTPEDRPLPTITSLVLDGNPIADWSSIDALSAWLPNISSLRVVDTPLFTDPQTGKYARQILTGRIKSLKRLNASEVTEEARKDGEIFYLNWIVNNSTVQERVAQHPRWDELVKVYGTPDEARPPVDTTRLQSRLIEVDVYSLAEEPKINSPTSVEEKFSQQLQILPSLPLKTLRLKLVKALKLKPTAKIKVYARLRRDEASESVWGEIDLTSSRQSDLGWWGVENGGHLGVLVL